MDEPWIRLLELLLRYRGRVLGALIGVVGAWLLVTLGLLKTIVLILCGVAGYAVGMELDRRGAIRRAVRRFWRGRP